MNILLRPVGAPEDYDEFLDDASTVELDTVPTLIPTVDSLLRGLAGGAHQPHPELLSRLREWVIVKAPEPEPHLVVQPPLTEAEQREDLEKLILETLERLGHPASIRDLLFAMNAYRRPPYKQAKLAAENLHARGWLLRDKDGNAHRYRLNAETNERIVNDIAALLATSVDPERTAARALKLVASDTADRRNVPDTASPNS